MKKILFFLCSLCFIIFITGCGNDTKQSTQEASLNSSEAKQVAPIEHNNTNQSTKISGDDAKYIALKDANVDEKSIYNLYIKQANYYNIDIYDVEFDTNDKEYNYNIDMETGEVLSMDYELEDHYVRNLPIKSITEDEAINLVLQNIAGATVQDVQIRREHDDNRLEYEGRVIFNNIKYEFNIDADAGIITEWKVDKRRH